MPFDIFIADNHGNPEKTVPLYLQDFESISELIKNNNKFPLLREALSNYYGDSEIFIQDLRSFQSEIILLEKKLKGKSQFLFQLLELVDVAIKNEKTIKFAGD